ncbi:thioesterase family protein [Hoylesella nanceiensis]|jgi:thioesterase family protein|uniref:thioesterase family protein n=1 Tax=Hoylesella nanceiensis TaxID=425941 RepID=UPI000366CC3F|nr:thioesterase family protein [Hoylesella nanceiensis]
MIKEGLEYSTTITVEGEHTALSVGSGDMQVLATPALIAFMENVAMLTVRDLLSDEVTTVGGMIEVKHLKASPVGAEVVVKATLEKVDGIKLQFKLEAFQGEKLIAEGAHLRFIVNRQEFMNRVLKTE